MCFRKLPVAEKFIERRRERVSSLSVEFFCLTVPKNLVGKPYSAVIQKKSCREKVYGKEAGVGMGEYQVFPSEIFCLTVPNKIVVESFSVSLCSVIESVMDKRRLRVSSLSVETLCFRVPKKFLGETCAVLRKCSGIEKVYR